MAAVGVSDDVADALALQIAEEQKLLAAYEARQAAADSKLTAAATGALALPAATLALAQPLHIDPSKLKVVYVVIVALVIVIFALRTWNGGKLMRRRRDGDAEHETDDFSGRVRRLRTIRYSTESRRSRAAREAWWRCPEVATMHTVQTLALELWRSRCEHSRDIAHGKEKLAAVASFVFIAALSLTIWLGVARSATSAQSGTTAQHVSTRQAAPAHKPARP
jgi:hypothetical protein